MGEATHPFERRSPSERRSRGPPIGSSNALAVALDRAGPSPVDSAGSQTHTVRLSLAETGWRRREMSTSERRTTRRDFLKGSAAVGVAAAAPAFLAGGASAASRRVFVSRRMEGKVVVATMPGPRWEGALRASAKTY